MRRWSQRSLASKITFPVLFAGILIGTGMFYSTFTQVFEGQIKEMTERTRSRVDDEASKILEEGLRRWQT